MQMRRLYAFIVKSSLKYHEGVQVRPPGGGEPWELQLKGAGLTPYSRSADGRKVHVAPPMPQAF